MFWCVHQAIRVDDVADRMDCARVRHGGVQMIRVSGGLLGLSQGNAPASYGRTIRCLG